MEVVCILDRREVECHGNSTTSGVGSARLYLNKVNSLQAKLHDIFPFLKDESVKDA